MRSKKPESLQPDSLQKRQMTWMRSMQGTLLLNPDEKVASLAVLKKEAEQMLSGLQQ